MFLKLYYEYYTDIFIIKTIQFKFIVDVLDVFLSKWKIEWHELHSIQCLIFKAK